MDPVTLYDYLLTARRPLFEAVRRLSAEQYGQSFPSGLGSIRRTLQHMAGAEWWLLGHLHGTPVGDYPFASARVPDFAALEREWDAVQQRSRDILLGETDWNRPVEITVTTPARKRYRVAASPARIFTQFCYHEIHHRAQAMTMLRQFGAPVESLDFLLLACEVIEQP